VGLLVCTSRFMVPSLRKFGINLERSPRPDGDG
jgi:hypothetical protein